MAETYEYARFGQGFVRRAAESTDDWMSCPRDDVPKSFFDDETRARIRREAKAMGGGDPFVNTDHVPAGAVLHTNNPDQVSKTAGFLLPNKQVDALASELGLTGVELRKRLTKAEGGTGTRVSDERFDEIMTELGIDPQVARERFADRQLEADDKTDELNFR